MFRVIFSLVMTVLNAWLVIDEASKGRDERSNALLVVFLFSLSASIVSLVGGAVMLMG